jgi:hypothetical protein
MEMTKEPDHFLVLGGWIGPETVTLIPPTPEERAQMTPEEWEDFLQAQYENLGLQRPAAADSESTRSPAEA